MVEIWIAGVGVLVAAGSLTTSWLAHRLQVERAGALDSQEARIAAREQRVESRERDADRREMLTQASMIAVGVDVRASQLHEDWRTTRLVIINASNQPVRGVETRVFDIPLGVEDVIYAGRTWATLLSQGSGLSAQDADMVTVDFTDAAGRRWRREGAGGLRQGTWSAAREQWEWGAREEPVVASADPLLVGGIAPTGVGGPYGRPPAVPQQAPPRRRSFARSGFVLAVVAVAALAGLLGWLLIL